MVLLRVFVALGLVSMNLGRTLQAEITDKVYFDLSIDSEPIGRLTIGLFGKLVPSSAANFKALCLGTKRNTKEGLPLQYKGTRIERVVKDYLLQGGDVSRGGDGGESAFGGVFADEGFRIKHSGPGVVSMVSRGPHTNGSQFTITLAAASWLDDKQVIIGEVIDGIELLDLIEAEGTESGDPLHSIEIMDSGLA